MLQWDLGFHTPSDYAKRMFRRTPSQEGHMDRAQVTPFYPEIYQSPLWAGCVLGRGDLGVCITAIRHTPTAEAVTSLTNALADALRGIVVRRNTIRNP